MPVNLPIQIQSPNLPQLLGRIANAKIQVDVWGRGTGKSSDHAWRVEQIVHEMPRSKNLIEGKTYLDVLKSTLPGIIHNLEKMGYYEDIHYVLNKKPPQNWPKCYEPPGNYDNTMAWYNGTLFVINSQDKGGKSRGQNNDTVTADELLTMDLDKLQKSSFPTRRGNKDKFSRCPIHHSIRLSSSMGYGSEFKYVTNFGNYYEADGNFYGDIKNKIIAIKLQMVDTEDIITRLELKKQYEKLQAHIRWYKSSQGIYYSESDAFDNIKVLGWDYIVENRKSLPDLAFQVEILNRNFTGVENGFYEISEANLYRAINNEFLDSLDYDRLKIKTDINDCRKDSDIRDDLPLDIGMDYGGHINWLVVQQTYDNTDWTQNAFFLKRPKLTQDVVNAFCEYYKFHSTKEVNYPYDHTAKPTDGKSTTIYLDEVCSTFAKNGWKVNPYYIGQAPKHHDKYMLSAITLKGGDNRFTKQMFNRDNCNYLLMSMKNAGLLQGRNGFEKDKSSEKKLLKINLREEATDGSDAWDTLHWWKNYHRAKRKLNFQPMTVR